MADEVLVKAVDVRKIFLAKNSPIPKNRHYLHAVDNVSLLIHRGETVGLVGESGCGKSTLGRMLIRLHTVTSGSIEFNGKQIENLHGRELRELRKDMQMIFQDPYASLNPRMRVFDSVKAPLDVFGIGKKEERIRRTEELLKQVEIEESQFDKYPHELSGGQCQRIVIARAMILDPSFIVCDEPVSALDVSVRSQVLNLMKRLQKERGLSYLFISHDLSIVRYLCDKVAVMYLGQIVESASKHELFENPLHPYTEALISAIPVPEINSGRKRIILSGDVPTPIDPPSGCRFRSRCPYADSICAEVEPSPFYFTESHMVKCHHVKEIAEKRYNPGGNDV
ncbi:MAG: ABC transporter ATP-binding protein [Oscillospiraceae bacterium]